MAADYTNITMLNPQDVQYLGCSDDVFDENTDLTRFKIFNPERSSSIFFDCTTADYKFPKAYRRPGSFDNSDMIIEPSELTVKTYSHQGGHNSTIAASEVFIKFVQGSGIEKQIEVLKANSSGSKFEWNSPVLHIVFDSIHEFLFLPHNNGVLIRKLMKK